MESVAGKKDREVIREKEINKEITDATIRYALLTGFSTRASMKAGTISVLKASCIVTLIVLYSI